LDFLNRIEATERIQTLQKTGQPFFFLTDFEGEKIIVEQVKNLAENGIFFDFGKWKNISTKTNIKTPITFEKLPESFEIYQKRFDFVKNNLLFGNSFLTNLTCRTPISTNWTLQQIFENSLAKFRVFWHDKFVCFSPEPFLRITPSGQISAFPMKGTIDATLPDAENRILNDQKEAAEHATIVDLLRNDISQIARNVRVKRWRYLTKIKKQDGKELLQVSSEIVGKLVSTENWAENLFKMLPAGSISGAPKPKTVEIIKKAEGFDRNFYTGVAGIFTGNGAEMVSCVLIRFIENDQNQLYFKSGGGITHQSEARAEYDEMIQKIYVPVAF
jgi:para-aminobenzoate synthetase component I